MTTLETFLTSKSLPPNYRYVEVETRTKLGESEPCERVYRSDICSPEQLAPWIAEYSADTRTSWRLHRAHSINPTNTNNTNANTTNITSPNKPKITRDVYVCHHSSKSPTFPQLHKMSKDTKCLAEISITLKPLNFKDYWGKKGFPAVVAMKFCHNHPLDTPEYLSMLLPRPEIKELYLGYIRDGMTLEAAMRHHQTVLESRFDLSNLDLTDASINPRPITVQHWYSKYKMDTTNKTDKTETLNALPQDAVAEPISEIRDDCSSEVIREDRPAADCPHCERQFSSGITLNAHIFDEHKSELIPCEYCNVLFTSSVLLRTHIEKHATGKINFVKCSQCAMEFFSKTELQVHETSHSNISGINVPEIDENLTEEHIDQINNDHHKTDGERNDEPNCQKTPLQKVTCKFCNKLFKPGPTYEKHVRSHENSLRKSLYVCKFCDKRFSMRTHLFDHYIQNHYTNYPFFCRICERPFDNHKSFSEHIKTTHEKSGSVHIDENHSLIFDTIINGTLLNGTHLIVLDNKPKDVQQSVIQTGPLYSTASDNNDDDDESTQNAPKTMEDYSFENAHSIQESQQCDMSLVAGIGKKNKPRIRKKKKSEVNKRVSTKIITKLCYVCRCNVPKDSFTQHTYDHFQRIPDLQEEAISKGVIKKKLPRKKAAKSTKPKATVVMDDNASSGEYMNYEYYIELNDANEALFESQPSVEIDQKDPTMRLISPEVPRLLKMRNANGETFYVETKPNHASNDSYVSYEYIESDEIQVSKEECIEDMETHTNKNYN